MPWALGWCQGLSRGTLGLLSPGTLEFKEDLFLWVIDGARLGRHLGSPAEREQCPSLCRHCRGGQPGPAA